MRERWADLKAAWRELIRPTWDHDDDPDLSADAAVRTAWVRSHGPITPPEDSA